jgi:hypothetical protein
MGLDGEAGCSAIDMISIADKRLVLSKLRLKESVCK